MSTLGVTHNNEYILACLRRRPMTASEFKMSHAPNTLTVEDDLKAMEKQGFIEYVDERTGYRIVTVEEPVELENV